MIQAIAARIDSKFRFVSGKVFYSGRAAYARSAEIYVLGFNPGGDPETYAAETVKSHTDFVLGHAPEDWSAYCDESWKDRLAGQAPLQRRLQHLLAKLGLNPRAVASSNLIFTRFSAQRRSRFGYGRARQSVLAGSRGGVVNAAPKGRTVPGY